MSAVLISQVVEPTAVNLVLDMLPLTADRKAAFLDVLISSGGNVTRAAKLLGMTRQNVYLWTQNDPAFAELFNDALEAGTDNLEERAYVRAMDTSDRMMELLLKARRPEKYRENINLQGEMTLNPDELVRTFALAFERLRAQRQAEQVAQLEAASPTDTTP